MTHDAGARCECVAEHRPEPDELEIHHVVPLGMGGPDVASNRVWTCPTTHANVHVLLRAWCKVKGEPPWETRRRFSPYVRALAERGYRGWMAQG